MAQRASSSESTVADDPKDLSEALVEITVLRSTLAHVEQETKNVKNENRKDVGLLGNTGNNILDSVKSPGQHFTGQAGVLRLGRHQYTRRGSLRWLLAFVTVVVVSSVVGQAKASCWMEFVFGGVVNSAKPALADVAEPSIVADRSIEGERCPPGLDLFPSGGCEDEQPIARRDLTKINHEVKRTRVRRNDSSPIHPLQWTIVKIRQGSADHATEPTPKHLSFDYPAIGYLKKEIGEAAIGSLLSTTLDDVQRCPVHDVQCFFCNVGAFLCGDGGIHGNSQLTAHQAGLASHRQPLKNTDHQQKTSKPSDRIDGALQKCWPQLIGLLSIAGAVVLGYRGARLVDNDCGDLWGWCLCGLSVVACATGIALMGVH